MAEETRLANDWTERYVHVVGKPIESKEVQTLVIEAYVLSNRMHYKTNICENFRGLDYETYLHVANAAKNDPLVRDMYNHYKPGFADHIYKAMIYFAENELKNNESEYVDLV